MESSLLALRGALERMAGEVATGGDSEALARAVELTGAIEACLAGLESIDQSADD